MQREIFANSGVAIGKRRYVKAIASFMEMVK